MNIIRFKLLLLFCYAYSSLFSQESYKIIGAGHDASTITVTTSSDNQNTSGVNTIVDQGLLPNLNAASRFLGHATLGADYETIEATSKMGIEHWVDAQLQIPLSKSVVGFMEDILITASTAIINNGDEIPNNFSASRNFWNFAWWQYTMTQPDLIRNRVALALSEIFVVSEFPDLADHPVSLGDYYDMLLRNSFGNFRDLLFDVTMHPAMGVYLTHVNNYQTIPELNRFPDENYAREVMQLFTIGLYELNPDGSQKLENGQPIPTYDNEDIIEFAKIFTGLTWGNALFFGGTARNDESYERPMRMFDVNHEPGEKRLLNDTVVPAGQTGMEDLNAAIDNLFQHPNVGPFIGYRLIQRLVKSNPSPAYISRVTAAFNDNGSGVRGDMKTVIKAILLDEEAQSCPFEDDAGDGRLREPMVRYTHIARAFNAAVESGLYRNTMDNFYNATFQRPLASRSVFNFFQTNFQPIGPVQELNKVAPEFQITNSLSITGYANELYEWLLDGNSNLMQYADIYNGEENLESNEAFLNLEDEIALQDKDKINQLIDRLDIILTHGQMTARTKRLIVQAVKEVPENRIEYRVKLAIYLTMISPDYLIIK